MARSTLPSSRSATDVFEFLGSAEAAEHLDAHRKGLEAAFEGLEVLKRKDCSRRQDDHLLAVAERLEGRAHDDFGLAVADIAAEQAVHGLRALHILLDFLDGGELVFGFGELEGVFELALPVAVR